MHFTKSVQNKKLLTLPLSLLLTFGTIQVHAKGCEEFLLGAMFLHSKTPNLFKSPEVEKAVQNQKSLTQPEQKIHAWLTELEKSYKEKREDPLAFGELKKLFHDQYITKAHEISESFFELQVRIARELGHGNLTLDDKTRQQIAKTAVQDQTDSLNAWLDYLLSNDTDIYPMWIKYWILTSVTKLSSFDPETKSFKNRSRGQGSGFPELNHEALALVINAIVNKVHGKSLDDIQDPELLTQLNNPNFGNMYSRAWILSMGETRDLAVTDGEWVKYNKGSKADGLVNSLKGMNTGWCTAGYSTAQQQLYNGDFYVYYSLDKNGQAQIPRLAIRMEDSKIAEVRGIAKNQNLDVDILATNILEKKLNEFGDEGKAYQKKSRDMKRVTELERKMQKNEALSREDLRFLYEIDEQIEGFGYVRDPRVAELMSNISKRNIRADLAYALDVKENQISLTEEEALKPGIVYHYGDLDLRSLASIKGLTLPQHIGGSLTFGYSLTSAEGLRLPQHIGGHLYLSGLTSTKGLTLPQRIGGSLDLSRLTSAKRSIFTQLQQLGGSLYIKRSLVKKIQVPQHLKLLLKD